MRASCWSQGIKRFKLNLLAKLATSTPSCRFWIPTEISYIIISHPPCPPYPSSSTTSLKRRCMWTWEKKTWVRVKKKTERRYSTSTHQSLLQGSRKFLRRSLSLFSLASSSPRDAACPHLLKHHAGWRHTLYLEWRRERKKKTWKNYTTLWRSSRIPHGVGAMRKGGWHIGTRIDHRWDTHQHYNSTNRHSNNKTSVTNNRFRPQEYKIPSDIIHTSLS